MDTTLSALGVGRSGRHALWHLGLACAAGGAVLEALTIAAPCAATEWLEDDDDGNASARAGAAIVIGQIIGAVGWAAAADFLGRREAIVLACVGATGTCAVAACASTPFAFEVHWRRPRPSTRHHAQDELSTQVGVAVCAASATGLFIPSLLLAVERAPVTARAGYATTLAAFVAVGSALVLGAHALLALVARRRGTQRARLLDSLVESRTGRRRDRQLVRRRSVESWPCLRRVFTLLRGYRMCSRTYRVSAVAVGHQQTRPAAHANASRSGTDL